MNLEVITGDITKFEGDVIFNSVGVESDNFGGICKSIVNASHSDTLKSQIFKVRNIYKLGEHFVTEGYGLPAENIVHIIMPYFDDDKNLVLYSKAIDMALNTCFKKGFKTIGIPLLGTGANKYPDDMALYALKQCVKYYIKNVDTGAHITIVTASDVCKSNNRNRLTRAIDGNGDYHSKEILKQFEKESEEFKKQGTRKRKPHYFESYKGIHNLGDYVDELIDDNVKYWKGRINRYLGYGTKSAKNVVIYGSNKYSEVAKEASITKDFAFKIIFALKMDVKEATQFLEFFGYTFTNELLEHRDNVLKNLIKNKVYDIVEINNELKDNKYQFLFSKE